MSKSAEEETLQKTKDGQDANNNNNQLDAQKEEKTGTTTPEGTSAEQTNQNKPKGDNDDNYNGDENEKQQGTTGDKKMSKNQLKKRRKWERAMEVKKRRKQQERETRLAKAKAEGRDVEAERKKMEENRKCGEGWAQRNKQWQENFEKSLNKFQLCFDCSFEDKMTWREVNSLASQIRYSYAMNKRAKYPVTVKVTSLGGSTLETLQNVAGFDQWMYRAFHYSEKSLLDEYPDKSKLCYLTSDSENVLHELNDNHVYIIGGIVDRNRLKRAAIDRATDLGIATAKLPIDNYLKMVSTQVLTCNHVFEILLKYKEHGNDWKKAFLDVLPPRKDIREKEIITEEVEKDKKTGEETVNNNGEEKGVVKET